MNRMGLFFDSKIDGNSIEDMMCRCLTRLDDRHLGVLLQRNTRDAGGGKATYRDIAMRLSVTAPRARQLYRDAIRVISRLMVVELFKAGYVSRFADDGERRYVDKIWLLDSYMVYEWELDDIVEALMDTVILKYKGIVSSEKLPA